MSAVSIRDAFVVYQSPAGGTAALQGLTLDVEPGEVVVLLGPSGSGKTTLLRVVAGFERLAAGSAHVFETDVARLEPRAAATYRASTLGLLDQHYARALSPDLTCRQTVALQLELLGGDADASRRAAEELLERVGLADRADARPGELSGGEQQRVAVCAAVAHRPRVLLADEPAGELDAASATAVYRLLGELVRERGATALVVSHDEQAASIADRLVHVRDGRVVEQSRPGGRRSLVVARGGWVRLPEPALRSVGSPTELVATGEDGRLVLEPAGDEGGRSAEPVAAAVAAEPAAGGGDVVAELRGVTRRFGARTVLDGLDAGFRAGRLTAVVGRSGSGKTTLLHLLAGLELPSEGQVSLLGAPLAGRSRDERAAARRETVALVTQEPGLVPYLSALENVELGLQLRGGASGAGDAAARARAALVAVGLEERLRTRAARLSAGERQRVAIARALAADVRLLLVDEPTARLDQENGREVGRLLLAAARERRVAVVCATHDPVLTELADDVLQLDARFDVEAVGVAPDRD
ncbi:MAG TPA: ATP-binding cassette domain-containing protein [Gaiellaceae bacterium]|nr:ATP-binding cassette domain-containing protein [Gaiellaceae bacterium]